MGDGENKHVQFLQGCNFDTDVERTKEETTTFHDAKDLVYWWYNRTKHEGVQAFDPRQLFSAEWDSWIWTALDTLVGLVGWLIFGKSWTQVRTGFSFLIRLGALLTVCVITHYLFALCWPVVSVLVGIIVTFIWLVRTALKCCGRAAFYAQRITGGVPEAAEADFFGPEMGETPETSDLRKLKKTGDAEKWVLIRREGLTAIFKVQESSSIRSSGLYLTHDPDSLRGDEGLLKALRGHDRVHICRHSQCPEDGQHFKQYALMKPFQAERFQLSVASQGAQQAGMQLFGWFRKGATQAVKKAQDFASESENEVVTCDAHLVLWEDEVGSHRLGNSACVGTGCTEACMLAEDIPKGRVVCNLCPKHTSDYLKGRFQLKCAYTQCRHLGQPGPGGLRLCEQHAEEARGTSSRRSSRSRSRTKERQDEMAEDEDCQPAQPEGVRRRPRGQSVTMDVQDVGLLLDDVRGEDPRDEGRGDRRKKLKSENSPGRTPRSSVQRSLARLGMINSPDRREVQTTLEEFFDQLFDGKEMGLDEEDVRAQLAARYGLSVPEFTKMLYEQATEEQRKGTKGLTKFLAKWRKQLAVETPDRSQSSQSPWSLVGSPGEGERREDEKRMPATPSTPKATETVEPKVVSAAKAFAVLPPPGIYGQDRKAGTGGPEPMTEIARAIQQQTSELATLVKAQNEVQNVPSGTLKGLNRTSEELVYLLRACGQYTVEVGIGEHGAGLANALLAAQAGASTKLRSAGFRQKVTPRLAVGLAGPYWGTQEKYSLAAADFLPCTDAELDNYAIECRTGKQASDQRPAAPTRFEDWQSRVQRQNAIWSLVYGREWSGVRAHALETLSTWHVQAPHKWPLQVLADVWEELHWRFFEELKGELRKIKSQAGRETMTLQDLKFYALMPDEHGEPPLQLPRTFDLHHPDGWFLTEVLPRIERRQERLLWKLTWEGGGKVRGPGHAAGGGATGGVPDDKLSLKNLLGPKLTPEEVNRAKDRAPVDKDGKLLCWGHLTHLGCGQAGCQRSHEALKGTFESLDSAVRMQLLRRGGLKRMKQESQQTATDKIKELRAQYAKDKEAKVKDGKDRRRAGQEDARKETDQPEERTETSRAGGVRWQAPVEMREVDFTAQEKEFAAMVKGPSSQVFEHVPREGRPHLGRGGDSAPQEAKDLLRQAQQLADGPVLGPLQGASDDLYAWAATRVANDPKVSLETLLEEMVQYGLGELASEAAAILEKQDGGKAGQSKRCSVGETVWSGDGPGRAYVEIDGTGWAMYDFKEEVMMSEELAGLAGVVQPELEKRQCVTKVLAAGCLLNAQGHVPTMAQVEELSQQFRLEQARQATDAEVIMGHPEAKVTAIEHELRMYTHDILKPHHDKDYRAVAVFPLEALAATRLIVLRVDYKGDVLPEVILGSQWSKDQPDLWALVWKGHMTLLVPQDARAGEKLLKEDTYATPSLGFHYFWHQRHDQPRTAPGQGVCRHCKPLRKVGTKEYDSLVRKTSCLPALATSLAGGALDPKRVATCTSTAGPSGLVLQEFFAGYGVISQGWRRAGEVALEEVELYDDPHHQRGKRLHHDLADPAVQQRYLEAIEKDEFNVEWIACPCTSYCDWNLQNGGTRTFDNPLGAPTAKEEVGNTLSTFGALAFEKALDRGHFPVAESSGLSGRYPKQWHLPCWQRILQRPDVQFIEIDMCSFGLAPRDQEDGVHFYKHRTGLAFPRHPSFGVALMRRCPGLSAQHQHVALKGSRDGTTVTRCTEAGVYAPAFVSAVVAALQSLLCVGGVWFAHMRQWEGEGEGVSDISSGGSGSDYSSEDEDSMTDESRRNVNDGSGGPGPDEGGYAEGRGGESEDGAEDVEIEEPEVAVDEIGGDVWWVDERTGLLWIQHYVPRRTMVVPGGPGCPYAQEEFEDGRWTKAIPADTMDLVDAWEILDNWRTEGNCEAPHQLWCGTTVFAFRGHDIGREPPWEQLEDQGDSTDRQDRPEDPGDGSNGDPEDPPEGLAQDEGDCGDCGAGGPEPSGMTQVEGDGGALHALGSGQGAVDLSQGRVAGSSRWTDFAQEGFNDSVKEAAFNYVKVIDEVVDNEAETWRLIRSAGDRLLSCAKTVENAAKALWIAREHLGRNNLAEADDPELDELLHPDLVGYLREVRAQGMPARFQGERVRVRNRPHPRARANMGQVYRQLMKDVAKHRVLVVDVNHDGLQWTTSSPFEAVPKMLPNRTLAAEVRLVHDQRGVNAGTDKGLHPPAIQPLHEQVVRRILFLKARYPGVKVVLAKKDVAGAFRLLWLDPQDVELFGGDVGWEPWEMGTGGGVKNQGDPEGLTMLYLVSSFGFSGSPGEWNVWGRATEELHRQHRPAEPRRDGLIHFDGKILVDDMVLVEPHLGLRPWASSEVYEWGVKKLLGEKAVNAVKDEEEGRFGPSQLIWGVQVNADTEKMGLPEARVAKGAHLLSGIQFNYGERSLTLKDLQRFRGIATGWATVVKGLKNELKAADRFLGGVEGGAVVQPSRAYTEAAQERAWEDLWDLFEDCRWLCARSETWSEKFGGDIREMLPAMERLGLPGQPHDAAVFITSDSTLELLAAIDWTNGFACRESLEALRPWVARALEDEDIAQDQKVAIHVGEMLSFVAFACQVGQRWAGKVVIYGGDNQVVYHWISSRRSGVRAGRLLIRVLNLVEMRFRCQVLGGWW
eukprot:s1496_g11.t1